MSYTIWTPPAVASEAKPWSAKLWRIVESQHAASTMKLVDTAEEQLTLETLLDESKPPADTHGRRLHYLMATPFRYHPLRGGSRFRKVNDPGVFYGAERVPTCCAEIGYWRWRFLRDSVDLQRIEPMPHTAFRVAVSTTGVDLRVPPFSAQTEAWEHLADYTATQRLAAAAREASVGAIVYRSVRDPEAGMCAAVLTPAAFTKPVPDPVTQQWWLSVGKTEISWRRQGDRETLAFPATGWE